jgi:hypothetical protein
MSKTTKNTIREIIDISGTLLFDEKTGMWQIIAR